MCRGEQMESVEFKLYVCMWDCELDHVVVSEKLLAAGLRGAMWGRGVLM